MFGELEAARSRQVAIGRGERKTMAEVRAARAIMAEARLTALKSRGVEAATESMMTDFMTLDAFRESWGAVGFQEQVLMQYEGRFVQVTARLQSEMYRWDF